MSAAPTLLVQKSFSLFAEGLIRQPDRIFSDTGRGYRIAVGMAANSRNVGAKLRSGSSREVSPGVTIEFDDQGKVIGLEILRASNVELGIA